MEEKETNNQKLEIAGERVKSEMQWKESTKMNDAKRECRTKVV